MIEFVSGDLLESRADMLVNPVNCVGVMGAGIALAFRRRWPDMFDDYRRICRAGRLHPGRLHGWRATDGTRIVNLPTKRDWRDASRYADIEAGLAALRTCIERFAPASVALPALGCGRGGLDWPPVATMIQAGLAGLDARILVHVPQHAGRVRHAERDLPADREGRHDPWQLGICGAAHRPSLPGLPFA